MATKTNVAASTVDDGTAHDQARRWLLRRAAVIFASPAGTTAADVTAPRGRLYCWMMLLLSKHAVESQAVLPELMRLNAQHGDPFKEGLLRETLQDAAEARELVGSLPRQRASERPPR